VYSIFRLKRPIFGGFTSIFFRFATGTRVSSPAPNSSTSPSSLTRPLGKLGTSMRPAYWRFFLHFFFAADALRLCFFLHFFLAAVAGVAAGPPLVVSSRLQPPAIELSKG
jgi:hypothetical protein